MTARFCIKCGKEIPEGANFCMRCGAPVYKERRPEDHKNPVRETNGFRVQTKPDGAGVQNTPAPQRTNPLQKQNPVQKTDPLQSGSPLQAQSPDHTSAQNKNGTGLAYAGRVLGFIGLGIAFFALFMPVASVYGVNANLMEFAKNGDVQYILVAVFGIISALMGLITNGREGTAVGLGVMALYLILFMGAYNQEVSSDQLLSAVSSVEQGIYVYLAGTICVLAGLLCDIFLNQKPASPTVHTAES